MENNVNNVKVEYGCIIDALKTIRVYNLPVYSLLIFFYRKKAIQKENGTCLVFSSHLVISVKKIRFSPYIPRMEI